MRIRFVFLLGALSLGCQASLYAQEKAASRSSDYTAEYSLIESVFGTLVRVIHDVTLQNEGTEIGARLREMAQRLNAAAPSLQAAPLQPVPAAPAPVRQPLTSDDLTQLERLLRQLHEEVRHLHDRLVAEEAYDLAEQLAPVARRLEEAGALAYRLAYEAEPAEDAADGRRHLAPGHYGADAADRAAVRRDEPETAEPLAETRAARRGRKDRSGRHRTSFDWYSDTGTVVGEFPHRWPYGETALYRTIPALRYNRVEGLVLGFGLRPLTWDDYERSRLYGQLGYALALSRWRYEVGVETQTGGRWRDGYGLRLSGAYRRNTATDDLWKSSWIENSLAAFFFEHDFFDYYEVEGWTLYAVQRLTPYAQLSAGFRAEDYRSLENSTTWSVFDAADFRLNPPVREGWMNTFAFALEGGSVAGFHHLPRGAAFRMEAELGQGLGGDFSFNRYVADGRLYVPVTPYSSLGLRLRGGLATGDVPPQKAFTLGGAGSVRAYPQNAFFGTRMLLANAEYVISDVVLLEDLFDDLQLFGFADAGWVNDAGTNRFDLDAVLPAAGFGVGLDDRNVRLELAWPLRSLGGSQRPTFWFRLSPTF